MAKESAKALAKKQITHVLQPVDMPKDLDEAAVSIKAQMQEGYRCGLVAYWNAGRIVDAIQTDEGKYGSRAVERVAEKLGKSARLLYDAKRFFDQHPSFETVTAMKLEWSSARMLGAVQEEDIRAQLEDKAQAEDLTVKQVKDMVAKHTNKGARTGKTRPKRTGLEPLPFWTKVERLVEEFHQNLEGKLKDAPAVQRVTLDEKVTPEQEYQEVLKSWKRVAKMLPRLITMINIHLTPLITDPALPGAAAPAPAPAQK